MQTNYMFIYNVRGYTIDIKKTYSPVMIIKKTIDYLQFLTETSLLNEILFFAMPESIISKAYKMYIDNYTYTMNFLNLNALYFERSLS